MMAIFVFFPALCPMPKWRQKQIVTYPNIQIKCKHQSKCTVLYFVLSLAFCVCVCVMLGLILFAFNLNAICVHKNLSAKSPTVHKKNQHHARPTKQKNSEDKERTADNIVHTTKVVSHFFPFDSEEERENRSNTQIQQRSIHLQNEWYVPAIYDWYLERKKVTLCVYIVRLNELYYLIIKSHNLI